MRNTLLRALASVLAASSDTTLIAFDFPPRIYKKAFADLKAFLESKGLTPEAPMSEWPHVSAMFIKGPTRDEIEKIKLALPAFDTKAKISGLEILPGRADLDYIAFELEFPAKKLYDFAVDIAGEEKVMKPPSFPVFRPHVSILTVPKSESQAAHDLMPEMEKVLKPYMTTFKPEQIQVWEDFQISDLEDNVLK